MDSTHVGTVVSRRPWSLVRLSGAAALFTAVLLMALLPAPADAAETQWKDGCRLTVWEPTRDRSTDYIYSQAQFYCNRVVYVEYFRVRRYEDRSLGFDWLASDWGRNGWSAAVQNWAVRYEDRLFLACGSTSHNQGVLKIRGWAVALSVDSGHVRC